MRVVVPVTAVVVEQWRRRWSKSSHLESWRQRSPPVLAVQNGQVKQRNGIAKGHGAATVEPRPTDDPTNIHRHCGLIAGFV